MGEEIEEGDELGVRRRMKERRRGRGGGEKRGEDA